MTTPPTRPRDLADRRYHRSDRDHKRMSVSAIARPRYWRRKPLTVPAVHRLYSAPDALSGGKVENLVANAESGSTSRVTLVTVRYQEDILVDDRGWRQPPAGPCWRSPRCGRRRPEPGPAPATGRACRPCRPGGAPRASAPPCGWPGLVGLGDALELVRIGKFPATRNGTSSSSFLAIPRNTPVAYP